MKYRCPCGGKYQVLLREKLPENDVIYNVVKTMCIECNKSGEFLFDITERENKKKKLEKKLSHVHSTLKDFRGGRTSSSSSSINILSGVAREIEDAFISVNELPSGPVNLQEIAKSLMGEPEKPVRKKEDNSRVIQELNNVKFLYAQAMMKIKYLEEENKLLHILEENLNKKEKEIRKLQNNIAELTVEIDKRLSEYNELQQKLLEKDDELEAYKKMMEDRKRGGWRKLLGGK
ncbi:MAG: hypothetical protein ABRQ39_25915 [Candidatus Eremiobacterota bacterium]